MIEVKIDNERTQVTARGASSELRTQVAFLVLAGARLMHTVDAVNGINYYYATSEDCYKEVSQINLLELLRQLQQEGDTDG